MSQYNTRIRLKTDTTYKWELIQSTFIPLKGEIIIYQDLYTRLKVGDGVTTLENLPFIDAGSIDGLNIEIVKVSTYNDLNNSIASSDKLYITRDTNQLYYYDTISQNYIILCPYTITTNEINNVPANGWRPGSAMEATINNHLLSIKTNTIPSLTLVPQRVVTDVTRT